MSLSRNVKYEPENTTREGGDFPSERHVRYLTFQKAKGTTFADKNIRCSTPLFQESPDDTSKVRTIITGTAKIPMFVSRTHILLYGPEPMFQDVAQIHIEMTQTVLIFIPN